MPFDHYAAAILAIALVLILFVAFTRGFATKAHGIVTLRSHPIIFALTFAAFAAWLVTAATLLYGQDVRGYSVAILPPLVLASGWLGRRAGRLVRPPAPNPSVAAILMERVGNTLGFWAYCFGAGLIGFPILFFLMSLFFPQLLRPPSDLPSVLELAPRQIAAPTPPRPN